MFGQNKISQDSASGECPSLAIPGTSSSPTSAGMSMSGGSPTGLESLPAPKDESSQATDQELETMVNKPNWVSLWIFVLVGMLTVLLSTVLVKNRVYTPARSAGRGIKVYRDCEEAKKEHEKRLVVRISPDDDKYFHVECNYETDGGGWTLIQKRTNSDSAFNKTWNEYKQGFGSLGRSFWLGNEKIHTLTKDRPQVLLLVLKDQNGRIYTGKYGIFQVAPEKDCYRITLKKFNGGNATNGMRHQDSRQFSTYDADHDLTTQYNCAKHYGGGWWFNHCDECFLNVDDYSNRILWRDNQEDDYLILFSTVMMVRSH